MADEKLPPEHIGNIPAGHKRDEENRRRTDSLAEQADAASGDAASIPEHKLREVDNEIAQYFDPVVGDIPISNKRPDRDYKWVLANHIVDSNYRTRGFTPVRGDPKKGGDKEAEEHYGEAKAAGSSLRGVGDVLLYWRPIHLAKAEEDRSMRMAIAMGAVEKNWAEDANAGPLGRSFGPLAHGDPNDPKLRSTVLRGSNGEVATLMDDIRSGNPIGHFKPGDDVRNR